jgi:hypothetical protein
VVESVNIFTGGTRLLLLPVKKLLDLRVPDDRRALVVIQKPLDDVRQRRGVDLPALNLERRRA